MQLTGYIVLPNDYDLIKADNARKSNYILRSTMPAAQVMLKKIAEVACLEEHFFEIRTCSISFKDKKD